VPGAQAEPDPGGCDLMSSWFLVPGFSLPGKSNPGNPGWFVGQAAFPAKVLPEVGTVAVEAGSRTGNARRTGNALATRLLNAGEP